MADSSQQFPISRRLTRDLMLDTCAADNAARRVPAVLSTEFAVDRDGYSEILEHIAGAIDLSRAPLPLLEQHTHGSLNIGIVENITLDGRTLRGEVVFGNSVRAGELWPDVRDGVVRSLSIGYLVQDQRVAGETVRVTRWQPFEVSLVSVPADPGAGLFRSFPMSETANPPARVGNTDLDAAVLAERTRVADIRRIAQFQLRSVDGGTAIEDEAIATGMSLAEFQRKVVDHLANIDRAAGGLLNRFSASSPSTSQSPAGAEGRDFVAAASDALLLRAGVRIATPHAAARDFRGMSVLDMARSCLSRSGRFSVNQSNPQALIRSAMSTSDFPALLGDTLWKSLRNGVESEQATHRVWCAVTEAADFRTQSRVILGSAPDLAMVLELGEYSNGPLHEDKTTLVPSKFGRIVSLSWESTLADNLGAFVNMGRSLGQAAMRAEADSLYGLLVANSLAGPNLADGLALFSAGRNNVVSVATGALKPLTAAALGTARAKLRRQVNVGGGRLNLAPRTLIVPPERETEAEILVASSTIHRGQSDADAATPAWIGALTVVAEPRLVNTDTFYLVADQSMIGTGEIVIVDDSPHIEEIEEPRHDALSWKVRHAFAAGFVDFRGIVKTTLTAS